MLTCFAVQSILKFVSFHVKCFKLKFNFKFFHFILHTDCLSQIPFYHTQKYEEAKNSKLYFIEKELCPTEKKYDLTLRRRRMGANFKFFTFGHVREYILDSETWSLG